MADYMTEFESAFEPTYFKVGDRVQWVGTTAPVHPESVIARLKVGAQGVVIHAALIPEGATVSPGLKEVFIATFGQEAFDSALATAMASKQALTVVFPDVPEPVAVATQEIVLV